MVERIQSTNSLGSKVEIEGRGTWDVYGTFGTISISRLNPQSGHRHRVSFSGDKLWLYHEAQVGEDLVKQEVRGVWDKHQNPPVHTEEWLTVESTTA